MHGRIAKLLMSPATVLITEPRLLQYTFAYFQYTLSIQILLLGLRNALDIISMCPVDLCAHAANLKRPSNHLQEIVFVN